MDAESRFLLKLAGVDEPERKRKIIGEEFIRVFEEEAKKVLSESEIDILVTLGDGEASATAWGCDLTYDYVKINGDYRT